jgi:hypothetical protein
MPNRGAELDKVIAHIVADAEALDAVPTDAMPTFVLLRRETVRAHPFSADELTGFADAMELLLGY